MDSDYEVIVVGGGPGGSTAARYCAKAGLKTLLVEKERFPRYKPCGGCLSVKTVHLLGFHLRSVIENVIYGAKFTYCFKDPFFIKSKEPIAYLVMRDRFDHLLLHKAIEEGTMILEGEKVIQIEEEENWITVGMKGGDRFRCQYLIGADGPNSIVVKSMEQALQRNEENGIAIECEIPFDSSILFPPGEIQFIHLDFGGIPNGYGWVFPKKEWLSIGIGGMFREDEKLNPRQYFNTFLKGLDYIPAEKPMKLMGHPLPSFFNENQKVSKDRILLVGDAAHLMDPLQGEGIYYAIRSGMLAAEAVVQGKKDGLSPADFYQRSIYGEIGKNLKWALSFSRFVFRFTKLAYKTLKRYPELGEFYLQVLEGKENYQGFVTRVKTRMKSLLQGRLSEKIKKAMAKT